MSTPTRHLGLFATTALVVASMVGTGVFTTTGFLLADLRSGLWVLLAWLAGGVLAACGALCYGALASTIPESGGEYVFLSRTVHPAAGYLAGWMSLTAGFAAPLASAAIAFGKYASPFLPAGFPPTITTVLILCAAALLHAVSHRHGSRVHAWVVVCELILIVSLAVFGLCQAQVPLGTTLTAQPVSFPIADFAVSLVWVSFSYAGWNAGVYIGGEVKNPEKTLPRALLLGTGFTTLLYLLLNTAFVRAGDPALMAGKLEVGKIAAIMWGGPALGTLVSALVALALAASISALTFTGPRVVGRMAQDAYLPPWLAPPPGQPPRHAITLILLLSVALATTATYEHLLTYIGVLLGLSNAATVFGLFRLKQKQPGLKVVGWPFVPVVFLLLVAWMVAFTIYRKPFESVISGATLVAGLVAYRLQRRMKAAPTVM
ncbi:MAG: amino acid permease [Deltaproteobacteria bacterium]|nr:amino acid permease [Deltaproteobacteria bacterium]